MIIPYMFLIVNIVPSCSNLYPFIIPFYTVKNDKTQKIGMNFICEKASVSKPMPHSKFSLLIYSNNFFLSVRHNAERHFMPVYEIRVMCKEHNTIPLCTQLFKRLAIARIFDPPKQSAALDVVSRIRIPNEKPACC